MDRQGELVHLWHFTGAHLLRGKRGGLSLTSVRVTVTDVVPESPPFWPTISFAWITSKYWSLASLSMFGRAVLMTPVKFQIPVKCITIHWIHTSEEHWHRQQGALEMLPSVVLFLIILMHIKDQRDMIIIHNVTKHRKCWHAEEQGFLILDRENHL